MVFATFSWCHLLNTSSVKSLPNSLVVPITHDGIAFASPDSPSIELRRGTGMTVVHIFFAAN